MQHTKNIFEVLSGEESEGDEHQVPLQNKKPINKQNKRKNDEPQASHHADADNKKEPRGDNEDKDRKAPRRKSIEKDNKAASKPTKGVTAEPHPKDRESGTGIGGVQKRFRKSGAGGGNIGSVQDELKGREKNRTDDDDD